MSRLLSLARKDFLQTRRDRLSAIFIIVMPLLFTSFFGLLFGAGSDRLPVAVHDADGGDQAKQLVAALTRSEVVRVVRKEAGAIETWMADGRAAAGLVIPAGFSDALRAGEPVELTVIATQGSTGAASATAELRSAAGRVVATELAARASAATLLQRQKTQLPQDKAALEELIGSTAEQTRPLAAGSLDDPALDVRVVAAGAAAGQVPTGFVLSSPGMLINFILFSLTTAGVALIVERKNGTLQRLVTTRVRRWEMIGGKALGMFVLTFVQQIILLAAGQVLFGVDYLRDPAALLLMMVSLSLVASALGLLLAAVLSSEQALIATSVMVSMGVAALSGAWFPLEITGDAFAFIGHLLPTAWILDGLRGIVVRGFGVADVLPAFWISLAWAAALFAVAVWRFRLSD